MSPTILRDRGYRFYFFSREEARKHVHIHGSNGEAKFWLEPDIELAKNHRLSTQQLAKLQEVIEEHYDELTEAWDVFFGG